MKNKRVWTSHINAESNMAYRFCEAKLLTNTQKKIENICFIL